MSEKHQPVFRFFQVDSLVDCKRVSYRRDCILAAAQFSFQILCGSLVEFVDMNILIYASDNFAFSTSLSATNM